MMNEDGQEILEGELGKGFNIIYNRQPDGQSDWLNHEVDENGGNGQPRQIIVGQGDNYIVTQDGLALQAVDGQQVIMCEVRSLNHYNSVSFRLFRMVKL